MRTVCHLLQLQARALSSCAALRGHGVHLGGRAPVVLVSRVHGLRSGGGGQAQGGNGRRAEAAAAFRCWIRYARNLKEAVGTARGWAHPILRDEGRAPDVDRDHGAAHELGPERAGERSPPANASAGCAAPGVPAPHGPAPVRAEAGVQQAVRARAPAVHMCMLMRVRALGRQPGPTGLCHREAQHGEGHGRERCRARRRRAGRHLPREQAEGELCVGQGRTVTNSFAHNRDRDPVAPGSALWRICEPTQEPRHGRENEVNKFLARQTKS